MNTVLRHPRAYIRRAVAFTLIEVLIVIALVATLTAIVVPVYAEYTNEAKILKGILDIREIEKAIATYQRETGELPEFLDDIAYLIENKPDSWGYPYVYLRMIYEGTRNPKDARKDKFLKPLNTDYDLYSIGKDGLTVKNLEAEDSHDDIVRAADGEYVGLARKF